MDGGSKDGSRDVANCFGMKYPCIKFRVQRFSGGVGPARIEAVRYALDNGYEFMVWGDSGNEYSANYLANLLSQALNKGCDVVSGFTVVRDGSVWSRLLFWYHIYHQLFQFVMRRHAPGNNKLVRTSIYRKVIYPPTSRSDDFFFSISASKEGIRFCHSREAIIKVSMPRSFKEVISWERSRVRGLIEGFYMIGGGFPPILPLWILYFLTPVLITALIFSVLLPSPPYLSALLIVLTSLYLLGVGLVGFRLSSLSREAYERPQSLQGIIALIGMYIHSVLTTYYTLKYLLILRKEVGRLRSMAREVLHAFGFPNSFNFAGEDK